MQITRREALGTLALAGTAAFFGGAGEAAAANEATAPRASTAQPPAVVPLPFDPTKLPGLSERLLVSHHDNNYAGAVKNLAAVQAQLDALPPDAPSFVVAGLRSRELSFANSRVLHELYFANLGGDGKPAGAVQRALAESHGSFGAFESKLRATAMGLAGGSGWAIVDLGVHDGALGIHASGDHTQTLALGAPLLVLDMYEHAYHMDYGAAAAKYVDAFFANLRWDEVDRRYARALAAARALRG